MKNEDIIRAWKDESYQANLNDEVLAEVPAHPAGPIEISDVDLNDAAGGSTILCVTTSYITYRIATEVLDCC